MCVYKCIYYVYTQLTRVEGNEDGREEEEWRGGPSQKEKKKKAALKNYHHIGYYHINAFTYSYTWP